MTYPGPRIRHAALTGPSGQLCPAPARRPAQRGCRNKPRIISPTGRRKPPLLQASLDHESSRPVAAVTRTNPTLMWQRRSRHRRTIGTSMRYGELIRLARDRAHSRASHPNLDPPHQVAAAAPIASGLRRVTRSIAFSRPSDALSDRPRHCVDRPARRSGSSSRNTTPRGDDHSAAGVRRSSV